METKLEEVRKVVIDVTGIDPIKGSPETVEEYLQQIATMADTYEEWMKSHPEEAQITWTTKKATIIGVMRDAIDLGLVQVNDNGRAVLTKMGCFDAENSKEPSINMVRVALEIVDRRRSPVSQ